MKPDWKINRVSDACSIVDNSLGIDVRLFANQDVDVQHEAFEELFDFLDVQRAVQDIQTSHPDFFSDKTTGISRVVLTPDFHKGSGIPVGTVVEANGLVIPQAIGNDICCGMRLLATDLPVEKLEGHWDQLQKTLRGLFFQGKRDIPMSPRQREAILRDGLPGLLATIADNQSKGIYKYYDASSQSNDLERIHNHGGFKTDRLFGFEKFINSSGAIDGRDPQIGSIGGGNHFVELQNIEQIVCNESARSLGLTKGHLAIMIHSGSVGLGHAIGGHFMDRAREIFPKNIAQPKNDFFMLPMTGQHKKEGDFYISSMHNAANFAFANRLFMGLMALRAIQEVLGIDVQSKLIYDAPHNLVWTDGSRCLHRKGATPAEGPSDDSQWIGKPVIIPGSMGSASYLLTGLGNEDALHSACHGAGRIMPRGEASHVDDTIFDEETAQLRIVTSVDPKSPMMQMRKDILAKYKERIKEEAPYAYKPITPVIQSVVEANIARTVAKLMPLCTIKG
jgi:tRNA-splicing ligase RtcB (3'-phosphate/5'-hydroxy nucleic acid ligase)